MKAVFGRGWGEKTRPSKERPLISPRKSITTYALRCLVWQSYEPTLCPPIATASLEEVFWPFFLISFWVSQWATKTWALSTLLAPCSHRWLSDGGGILLSSTYWMALSTLVPVNVYWPNVPPHLFSSVTWSPSITMRPPAGSAVLKNKGGFFGAKATGIPRTFVRFCDPFAG